MNNETITKMTKRKAPTFFEEKDLLNFWKDEDGLLNFLSSSKEARFKYGKALSITMIVEIAEKYIPDSKNMLTPGMLYNMSTRYNALKNKTTRTSDSSYLKVQDRLVQVVYIFAINERSKIKGAEEFIKNYKNGKFKSLLIEAEYFNEDLVDYEPKDVKTSERIEMLVRLIEGNANKLDYMLDKQREENHYQQVLNILIDEMEEIVKESTEEKLKSKIMGAISKFRQNLKR